LAKIKKRCPGLKGKKVLEDYQRRLGAFRQILY
jgi:hypothetical protein